MANARSYVGLRSTFHDTGRQEFKNIGAPVRAFERESSVIMPY
jgi:hypothetical protein